MWPTRIIRPRRSELAFRAHALNDFRTEARSPFRRGPDRDSLPTPIFPLALTTNSVWLTTRRGVARCPAQTEPELHQFALVFFCRLAWASLPQYRPFTYTVICTSSGAGIARNEGD